MISFETIAKNIKNDIEIFEKSFLEQITETGYSINEVLKYINTSNGKRLRPILVYLSSRLFGFPNKTTHIAALIVEIIHTATLLHDDVIDDAELRRGRYTVNKKWNNKTAILSGDYMFAKAMKIATENKEYKLFDLISPVILNLTIGELEQMYRSKTLELTEENYFDIIYKKTASLIEVACHCGALSTSSENDIDSICSLRNYGKIVGLIFQIKDDILDYFGSERTGKLIGKDIIEGNVTLPLIYAMQEIDSISSDRIKEIWYSKNRTEKYTEIINLVKKSNSLKRCKDKMYELRTAAIKSIDDIHENEVKRSFIYLIDYIIDREN